MAVEERREKILQLVETKKRVKVAELKEIFGLSAVTIGNDLSHLEQQGHIVRNFGSVEIRKAALLSASQDIENFEAKKRIAKYAAGLIPDNASIMLYTSSSVLILARMIRDKTNLNVVTNSFNIAHEMSVNASARVILLGGYYNLENQSSYGEPAVEQLEQYNCDLLFFACNGVCAISGLTIDEPYERDINMAMLNSPMKKILLADSNKIGRTRFVPIAPITAVDLIITDSGAPLAEIERIEDSGVQVGVV
jgi:DeoR family transcriptional regulator of aga operon